jgi:hypothetical protein
MSFDVFNSPKKQTKTIVVKSNFFVHFSRELKILSRILRTCCELSQLGSGNTFWDHTGHRQVKNCYKTSSQVGWSKDMKSLRSQSSLSLYTRITKAKIPSYFTPMFCKPDRLWINIAYVKSLESFFDEP